MALIVQKYGGTSVGMVERIRNVARRVAATREQGNDVVVVVSAMSGETNRLLNLANQVSAHVDDREIDVLLASGEQVSCALLALALRDLGQPARSFLGHQVRIATDSVHGRARIKSIDSTRVVESLKRNEVVVVAGFQGVDEDDNITTLGRGGSDTSAVAMAAALGASVCEIYTDVDGIYTADPFVCTRARKLDRITYDENAGDGQPGSPGAADPLGGAGEELRRQGPPAFELQRRRGHLAGRGGATNGFGSGLGSDL